MIPISRPVTGDDFVNRQVLLRQLHAAYPDRNAALVGPRRIGKSSVAEEFLRTLPEKNTVKFRFNVQANMGTPGKFGVRLLVPFLKSYFEQIRTTTFDQLDDIEMNPSVLIDAANQTDSKTLSKLAQFLATYFPPSPENERPVLERILRFLDSFLSEMGLKGAIVLDEFQGIVDLANYKDFSGDKLLGFLEEVISRQQNVWYLFTGSAVRMMNDILENPKSPFYGRVDRLNVTPFHKDDSRELAHKCTNKPMAGEAFSLLYSLSNGHPFYIVVVMSKAEGLSNDDVLITRQHVEEAFISELARGALGSHCRYLFDTSLGRIKRGTFLKELLRELSAGEASLTELSRRIGRSSGYLSLPLSSLYNLDLVDKKAKRYFITDPILQLWLNSVCGLNEPKLDVIRKNLTESYQEYISGLKTDLGVYFEYYLREMLRKFNGQAYGDLRLPRFTEVDSGNAFDDTGVVFGKPSNVEVDALCLGEENWICEFTIRKKTVGKKDIDLLMSKKAFFKDKLNLPIHRLMYVAKSGFTGEALKSEVWCVTFHDLNHLLAMLNMRKTSEIMRERL
jgi:AAA+ ATPase superfamily predicted ATPase